jgi:hypothetical protein
MGKQARKPTPEAPIAANKPARRDASIPPRLWELPTRIERANSAGPRFTQLELARRSQLSQSVISRLMSWSNLNGIQLATIYRLARALKVSVAWLLGEEPQPPRQPRAAVPAGEKVHKTERPTHRRLRVGKGPSRRTG